MLLSTYVVLYNMFYMYIGGLERDKRGLEEIKLVQASQLEVKGINVIPGQKLCRNCQCKINEILSDPSIDTFSEDIAVPEYRFTINENCNRFSKCKFNMFGDIPGTASC